jgi:hypothetical protein
VLATEPDPYREFLWPSCVRPLVYISQIGVMAFWLFFWARLGTRFTLRHRLTQGDSVKTTVRGALLGALLLLAGCAAEHGSDYQPAVAPRASQDIPDELALRLDDGMTTQQVLDTLNYRPNRVTQQTCGQDLGSPWACRQWVYSDGTHTLTVTFRRDLEGWVVNDWNVW